MCHDNMKGKPVLILANKQDLPGALDKAAISSAFKEDGNDGVGWLGVEGVSLNVSGEPSQNEKGGGSQLADLERGMTNLLVTLLEQLPQIGPRVDRDVAAQTLRLNAEKEQRQARIEEWKRAGQFGESGKHDNKPAKEETASP
ncbi:hypothetical protein HK104_000445 [Borealophlyctis nickersoniae]|nr:hypothetical protein HK104_000445 [Borealophlyctis nickersoniae]